MKKILIATLGISLIIVMAVWILLYKTGDQSKFPIIQTSQHGQIAVISLKQWRADIAKYVALTNKQNPRVALSTLRNEIKTNDALSRNCHELTHEIGHAAFKKYKTFAEAMQYQDDVCNSGYIHGVIESYFDNHKNTLSVALHTACSIYRKDNFAAWECFHGIGHGVMFATNNDVPKSIKLCKELQDNFAYSACVNGVFMQNFDSDDVIHPSNYVSKQNFFYPCNQIDIEDMTNCYTYAPTYFLNLHSNNYAQALQWCERAPYYSISTCASGVGSETMKQNNNNPKFVEQICSQGPDNEQQPCLEGAISLYIFHYGSLTPAKNLCKTMGETDKNTCDNTVATSQFLFN